MGKGRIMGYCSSYALWEHTIGVRFNIDKSVYVSPINRMFRNVISVCYSKGMSQSFFVEKLKQDHAVNLSWKRVRELAGLGVYSGENYKGYLNYEWLTAISFFCGYSLPEMMSIDIPLGEDVKKKVCDYWAGKGKGSRAVVDLRRDNFLEALNYKKK